LGRFFGNRRYWKNPNEADKSLGSNTAKLRSIFNNIDESLKEEFHIWRIVHSGMATLDELETTWNFDDVKRAMAYLDVTDAIENTLAKGNK
jgi:hypothetical protein